MKHTHFLIPFIAFSFLLAACSNNNNSPNESSEKDSSNSRLADSTTLRLEKVWETDTVSLKTPESAIFDSINNVLYVSCINNVPPDKKDQDGYIAKIGLDGKIIDTKWIQGLNAPKGMGIYKGKLYVADIDQVIEIDIQKKKITKSYRVEKAKFLNDITVKNNGEIFISDSYGNAIYVLSNGNISLWIQNDSLGNPNGLMALDDALYMSTFTSNEFIKFNYLSKEKTQLATGITEGDGVVWYNDTTFLLSGWSGYFYQYTPQRKAQEMLNTATSKIHAADIWYIKEKNLLLTPTFFHNSIVAYKVK